MVRDSERKPNEPSGFGPLLIWTTAVAGAAFLYAGIYGIFSVGDGRSYWYPDAVFAALWAAPIGLVFGLAHEFVRKW